jgi:hypothetical protein
MMRCTVTDVAWFTLAQPTAVATAGADDEAPAPAEETVADPHPASAEHSSTVSTDPRTWRGDIMLL